MAVAGLERRFTAQDFSLHFMEQIRFVEQIAGPLLRFGKPGGQPGADQLRIAGASDLLGVFIDIKA